MINAYYYLGTIMSPNDLHLPQRQVFHEFLDRDLVQQDEIHDSWFVSGGHGDIIILSSGDGE